MVPSADEIVELKHINHDEMPIAEVQLVDELLQLSPIRNQNQVH